MMNVSCTRMAKRAPQSLLIRNNLHSNLDLATCLGYMQEKHVQNMWGTRGLFWSILALTSCIRYQPQATDVSSNTE